jgi:hypothetical protein
MQRWATFRFKDSNADLRCTAAAQNQRDWIIELAINRARGRQRIRARAAVTSSARAVNSCMSVRPPGQSMRDGLVVGCLRHDSGDSALEMVFVLKNDTQTAGRSSRAVIVPSRFQLHSSTVSA